MSDILWKRHLYDLWVANCYRVATAKSCYAVAMPNKIPAPAVPTKAVQLCSLLTIKNRYEKNRNRYENHGNIRLVEMAWWYGDR